MGNENQAKNLKGKDLDEMLRLTEKFVGGFVGGFSNLFHFSLS